jgi:serine/threonine-protein kinase
MIGRSLSHYQVLEKIGEGGMGEVYRARDEHLGRDVAIKVLPSGTLSDEKTRKRFRTEALALSKLNHPNIATVHDFDTQEGTDFIVMELVEGASLSEVLKVGSLPKNEISELGAQIADALEEAHDHGIVHRDLKPGNIAVTPKGRIKVLDFGLARMFKPVSDEATTEALTQEQLLAGTLPYMSPEELRGEKADRRSDLYAFGVVLYEMATGRRPFEHTHPTALVDAIIHKPPEPPSTHNRHVSPGLESIIYKALDKNPSHRYQSASEMRVDLERLSSPSSFIAPKRRRGTAAHWLWSAAGIAAVSAVLLALNIGGLRDRISGGPSLPSIDSIAVLPLENLSGDPEQEYFADGMTDALIAELAKIGAIKVISRTSVMQYKRVKRPLREIAGELDVDGIVEGTVLRAGDRVRITVQLINADTDAHLWANSYEDELQDVLRIQREAAQTIAREIKITLTAEEQELLAAVNPVNHEAYETYLKGHFFANQYTPQGIRKGVEYFNQAIELDPTYAPAHAGLADAYSRMGTLMSHPTREAFSRAKQHAMRALEIDDTLALAHTVLADAKMNGDWDWEGAEQSYLRAIELGAGDAFAHWRYGVFLTSLGRTDESLAELRKAVELDPLSLNINTGLGVGLLFAGLYDDSIRQLQKVLELDPQFALANILLSVNYTKKSLHNEAIAAAEQGVADTRRLPHFLAFLAIAYESAGQREDTLAVLEELNQASSHDFVPPEAFAAVYGTLGEMDRAFEWLDKAFDGRARGLAMLKTAPWLGPLRQDHRYEKLLRRMNFPE